MDFWNNLPDEFKAALVNALLEAISDQLVSRSLDCLIEHRQIFLAYGEGCWDYAVSLVTQMNSVTTQMTATGWQRHSGAIASAGQTCNQMVKLIEQGQSCGYHHCVKTIECIKSIPKMELRWIW